MSYHLKPCTSILIPGIGSYFGNKQFKIIASDLRLEIEINICINGPQLLNYSADI